MWWCEWIFFCLFCCAYSGWESIILSSLIKHLFKPRNALRIFSLCSFAWKSVKIVRSHLELLLIFVQFPYEGLIFLTDTSFCTSEEHVWNVLQEKKCPSLKKDCTSRLKPISVHIARAAHTANSQRVGGWQRS